MYALHWIEGHADRHIEVDVVLMDVVGVGVGMGVWALLCYDRLSLMVELLLLIIIDNYNTVQCSAVQYSAVQYEQYIITVTCRLRMCWSIHRNRCMYHSTSHHLCTIPRTDG